MGRCWATRPGARQRRSSPLIAPYAQFRQTVKPPTLVSSRMSIGRVTHSVHMVFMAGLSGPIVKATPSLFAQKADQRQKRLSGARVALAAEQWRIRLFGLLWKRFCPAPEADRGVDVVATGKSLPVLGVVAQERPSRSPHWKRPRRKAGSRCAPCLGIVSLEVSVSVAISVSWRDRRTSPRNGDFPSPVNVNTSSIMY